MKPHFLKTHLWFFLIIFIVAAIGCGGGSKSSSNGNTSNQPPVLDAIGNHAVSEGELLEFVISATDPNGDDLTYYASNLPSGSTFDPDTQEFSWTPQNDQVGNYQILFFVSDNGSPVMSDSEEITITVGDVNQPPALDAIGDRTLNEGELLEFIISATDPDGDTLTYSVEDLPSNATFNEVTQEFSWAPQYDQAGDYQVLFSVTDNGSPTLSDSEQVTITVNDINMLLLDNFPGYPEDSDWDDSWTQGVGTVQYFSDDPGFARLQLTGPADGDRYHNAEIKHYNNSNEFLYCDLEIKLRNSNNNGWDAPDSSNNPDPTYGFGSRGWGLWNDQMVAANANVIWFTSISPESDDFIRGTAFWIAVNGTPILLQELDIDLTDWHVYRIEWRQNYLAIYVDDVLQAEVTNSSSIPGVPLNFVAWTDNYRFSGSFSNLNIYYLDVPDIEQYIEIDYIKILQ